MPSNLITLRTDGDELLLGKWNRLTGFQKEFAQPHMGARSEASGAFK
jgi:hypothetical protein